MAYTNNLVKRFASLSKRLSIMIFCISFVIFSTQIPLDAAETLVTSLTKSSSWGEGPYVTQYSISLTNSNSFEIKNWRVEVSVPSGATIQDSWNASFQIDASGSLVITPASYNGLIQSKSTVSDVGFQLVTSSPTGSSVKVKSATADRSVPTPTPTPTPVPKPTAIPTSAPTIVPTAQPTAIPTSAPTPIPTVAPTIAPTAQPTKIPTIVPTPVGDYAAPNPTPQSESVSVAPISPTTPDSPSSPSDDEDSADISNPSPSQTTRPEESLPEAAGQISDSDSEASDPMVSTANQDFDDSEAVPSESHSSDSGDPTDDDDGLVTGIIDNNSGTGTGNKVALPATISNASPQNDNSAWFFFFLIVAVLAISIYNFINRRREKQEKESLSKIAVVFAGEQLERFAQFASERFKNAKTRAVVIAKGWLSKIRPSTSNGIEVPKDSDPATPSSSGIVSTPENLYSQAQRLRPPKKIDMSTDN